MNYIRHPLKTLMICTIGLMYFCSHGLRASLFQASKFVLCGALYYARQQNWRRIIWGLITHDLNHLKLQPAKISSIYATTARRTVCLLIWSVISWNLVTHSSLLICWAKPSHISSWCIYLTLHWYTVFVNVL